MKLAILSLRTMQACSKAIKKNKESDHIKFRAIALWEEKGWKKHLGRSCLTNPHVFIHQLSNKTNSDTHKPSKTRKVC